MNETKQTPESQNLHARFSDLNELIHQAACRSAGLFRGCIAEDVKITDAEYWQLFGNVCSGVRSILPGIEKHFREKFEAERIEKEAVNKSLENFDAVLKKYLEASKLTGWGTVNPKMKTEPISEWAKRIIPSKEPAPTSSTADLINALNAAMREVENSFDPPREDGEMTQREKTIDAILKALEALADSARKEYCK